VLHLQGVRYLGSTEREFPFSLPLLQELKELEFSAPITMFVGENGSGKSTILEGIAALVQLPSIGGKPLRQDDSLRHAHRLARSLRPVWQKKVQRGFFLRAEDFFGFVRSLEAMRRELRQEMEDSRRSAQERGASDYAVQQSAAAWAGQLAGLRERYGEDLDAASHGESFLNLLSSRLVPQGLYLIDEPEAAISPMRQLALIALFLDAVREMECQFIVATHSPILLACPGAELWHFSSAGIEPREYDDLEHIRFTRDFLKNKEAFLRYL